MSYDPTQLPIGIIHFGLGNFHRAHQAAYTETAIEWYLEQHGKLPAMGICGVSLRHPDNVDKLTAQHGCYTLVERDEVNEELKFIHCIRECLFAPRDVARLRQRFMQTELPAITITVTEKGYYRATDSDRLLSDHENILADWHGWRHHGKDWWRSGEPKTLLGWLALGLKIREQLNLPTPSIISCDNLPNNGKVLSGLLDDFCRAVEPEFADWIAEHTAIPCTMVDRITPATTDADCEYIQVLGINDKLPVITEPFKQWVIQRHELELLEAWQAVGVEVVDDVEPYELYKLRILNGCHSTLAYYGSLLGIEYIHEVMQDPEVLAFLQNMVRQEILPSLPKLVTLDAQQYSDDILKRFSNPALHHRCQQIAMDGSQKLPQRLLNTIVDNINADRPYVHLSYGVAVWMRYLAGKDIHSKAYSIQDPLAGELQILSHNASNAAELIHHLFTQVNVFPTSLVQNHDFAVQLAKHLMLIETDKNRLGLTEIN